MGEITRQMNLLKQLSRKKSGIVNKWFDRIIATYPVDTAQFLASQKDPFANPVGQTNRQNLEAIFDQIVSAADPNTVREFLDPIIRIRAVQDFSPSQATAIILALKKVIRDHLKKDLSDSRTANALLQFESKIDSLCLFAFDLYMECREKIYELKTNEERNKIYKAFERAGLIAETSEGTPGL